MGRDSYEERRREETWLCLLALTILILFGAALGWVARGMGPMLAAPRVALTPPPPAFVPYSAPLRLVSGLAGTEGGGPGGALILGTANAASAHQLDGDVGGTFGRPFVRISRVEPTVVVERSATSYTRVDNRIACEVRVSAEGELAALGVLAAGGELSIPIKPEVPLNLTVRCAP